MPHPEMKKQRLEGNRCNNDEHEATADINNYFLVSIESLSVDELANILGFLLPQEIMRARVNKKMREAAKITISPLTDFVVDSVKKYNAMSVMAIALPNLQKIKLGYLGGEHKFVDGEDPDEEEAARTADLTSHDIEIISNFRKLRELTIGSPSLNGRYPCFFNFPHLQKLNIEGFDIRVKFDLEMLAGLPVLKELKLDYNKYLTGNINSLRVLKDSLEKVRMRRSDHVEGNFMDLADFPHLKEVDLRFSSVTGDIRDIGEKDFPSLTVLVLPNGGNGGMEEVFQRISDAQDVIRIPYLFQKQRPEIVLKKWYARLSDDSPDRYDDDLYDDVSDKDDLPPFYVVFVRAGTRCGYRWENAMEHPCEVNWLDPEPDRESSGFGKYMEDLQEIEGEVDYFKGYHQPPPQEEFERILERYNEYIQEEYGSGNDGQMTAEEFDLFLDEMGEDY